MPNQRTKIQILPKKLSISLTLISIILIAINSVTWYLDRHTTLLNKDFVRLFNLNTESNIPTTFSVILFFIAFFLLCLIAIKTKTEKQPYFSSWVVMAVVFLYFCFDEGSAIHEMSNMALRGRFGSGPFGIFTDSWIYLAAILIPVLIILLFKFFIHLPVKIRQLFSFAGILYIFGAVGMEMVGGVLKNANRITTRHYFFAYTLEESLEMFGLIVFIYALTSYLFKDGSEIQFSMNEKTTR